jgi:hypothetical protein|tara:strand:- start:109 stop:285 length:177 start_codon:yes stop_codon:yes gene_type:complete
MYFLTYAYSLIIEGKQGETGVHPTESVYVCWGVTTFFKRSPRLFRIYRRAENVSHSAR